MQFAVSRLVSSKAPQNMLRVQAFRGGCPGRVAAKIIKVCWENTSVHACSAVTLLVRAYIHVGIMRLFPLWVFQLNYGKSKLGNMQK